MPEQHNIEFKKSWLQDHLKTICAFANSHGGKLYIGKDDKGKMVGISEYKKLMDDLPNKIKNHLGITAATATRDLAELVDKHLLLKEGKIGAGTVYTLKPS